MHWYIQCLAIKKHVSISSPQQQRGSSTVYPERESERRKKAWRGRPMASSSSAAASAALPPLLLFTVWKGIASLVLEKSQKLRADGVAIGVHANGWRALHRLGVATELRETATLITAYRTVQQPQNKTTLVPARKEVRCLKRQDLVETLAKNLPAGTIRFGCHIAAIDDADSTGHGAVLTTVDGSTIKAKVLIGCDGANSVVAKYLGLRAPSQLPRLIILGFTSYPQGHTFGTEFLRLGGDDFALGRIPVTDNLVHFFMTRSSPSTDISNDASAAKEYVLEKLQECPADVAEMVRRCDPQLLRVVTKVWYQPPWRVMLGRFQRGTVTIAGDAMHVMGPFIGQGGSAALEDAVVLARALSRAAPDGIDAVTSSDHDQMHGKIGAAIGRYVRERRPRVALLSLENFAIGTLMRAKSLVKKLVCVAILALLGSESRRHANYDCGRL